MRKFGLIGYPLGHSFSKKYFTEKFNTEHISDCSYENYPFKSLDEFRELVASDDELCGLNITIPYKSEIIRFLDVIEPEADQIGAVNVMNALVLGTGGSSRAVCHVLKEFGLKVDLVSRDRKPGVLVYSDIDSGIIDRTQLIINTTPLGMFPNTESKPDLNYRRLNSKHILFDLIYNPEFTSFLRMGSEQGCSIISGIKMLHSQAEKAWEIWNNDNL